MSEYNRIPVDLLKIIMYYRKQLDIIEKMKFLKRPISSVNVFRDDRSDCGYFITWFDNEFLRPKKDAYYRMSGVAVFLTSKKFTCDDISNHGVMHLDPCQKCDCKPTEMCSLCLGRMSDWTNDFRNYDWETDGSMTE